MANLEEIELSLHRLFHLLDLPKDPAFSRFIPRVYEPIGFNWQSFFEPEFVFRFNGLMLKGKQTVNTVFLAVFPTDEVLDTFLSEAVPGDLLFMHHPLFMECGDPRGKWGRGFLPVALHYLQAMREKRLSVYTCHIPMDTAEQIGTGPAIAEALGANVVERFCPEGNGFVGLICDLPVISSACLIERAKELFSIPYVDFGGKMHEQLQRIAILPGCGDVASVMQEAQGRGAQAYLTGEIDCHIDNEYGRAKYQAMMEYISQTEMSLIGVSHSASEYLVMKTQMADWFRSHFQAHTRLLPQDRCWR